jgi:tetratricopeptide (TPR) repeat protein
LLRTTPGESSSQLARLRLVIEKTNTAEQRMAVYEQLLADHQIDLLDVRVASRLALDAALLQRQLGDVNQFARWLAESVALDPSYTEATLLAVGFFGDDSADIFTRAELLATAVLSNIRDLTLQVSLAEFLMSYGDYKDASAMYQIISGDDENDYDKISDGLLADIALSKWAAGDAEGALAIISARQTAVDVTYRKRTKEQQPRLTPLEIARIHAPLVPKLATIRAAIYCNQEKSEYTENALGSVLSSLATLAQIYESQGPSTTKKVVEINLQAAWISLWLGDDVEEIERLIEIIEKKATIEPTEKQRFEGWLALKRGDIEDAISILSGLPDDISAQVGLGEAYVAAGNKKAAANIFLDVARNSGGSIVGVWARKKLEKLVGTTFIIRPEVVQLQELMSGLQDIFDTIVFDPRSVTDLHLVPEKNTYEPYEPLLVQIELTNNTSVPLSIEKNGPIQPLLLIEALVEIPGVELGRVPPIIVPINIELSLEPKEKLQTEVDLRQYWPGKLLNMFPLKSASLTLRAKLNFTARETKNRFGETVLVYDTGRLGTSDVVDSLRIDGVRLTDKWLANAIAEVKTTDTIDELITMVLLTWCVDRDRPVVIVPPLIPPPPNKISPLSDIEIIDQLKKDAITTVLTTFPTLGPISQYFVLATMSEDPSVEAVAGMLKEPNSQTAIIVKLLRLVNTNSGVESLESLWFKNAKKSDNKSIKTIATWVYSSIKNAAKTSSP